MEGSRTERNVRTVNAQGALSLIRCKPGELKEMCGPYERCARFVTAFSVRTDRKSKMRTESGRVYWTCVDNEVNLVRISPCLENWIWSTSETFFLLEGNLVMYVYMSSTAGNVRRLRLLMSMIKPKLN